MKRPMNKITAGLCVLIFIECFFSGGEADARPQFRKIREPRSGSYEGARGHEGSARSFAADEGLEYVWDPITSLVTLKGKNISVTALVGSEQIVMQGQVYRLKIPLVVDNGEVVIAKDFVKLYEKVFRDVRERAPEIPPEIPPDVIVAQGTRKIVLDPGHGDHNFGAVGRRGTKEKDVVLDIAFELKKLLEAQGKKILMTRSRDVFVKLEERANMTNRYDPDIFISIHANASKNRTASGTETYHFSGASRAASSLARLVQKEIAIVARSKNRGVKTANFYVIKKVNSPAILIETGFLTNPGEEGRLATKSYRKQIAQAIFKGIMAYDKSLGSSR